MYWLIAIVCKPIMQELVQSLMRLSIFPKLKAREREKNERDERERERGEGREQRLNNKLSHFSKQTSKTLQWDEIFFKFKLL